MGLFSSKYVTTVGTTVSRVISDELIPDSIKTGSIKSMLAKGDTGEYIMEDLVDGLAIKASRMYRYGQNKYTYGLPSGEFYSANRGIDKVQQVLTSIEGQPVDIEYSRFGPPNNMHIAWTRLIEQYGYDPVTNKLNALSTPTKEVFLHDMFIELPANGATTFNKKGLDQWSLPANSGKSPSRIAWTEGSRYLFKPTPVAIVNGPIVERAKFFTAHLEITTVGFDNQLIRKVILSAGTVINLSGFNDEADYIHIKYTVNGVIKYKMYEIGTGVYPLLDSIMDTGPVLSGEFYPFAYFRYNKQSQDTDKDSPAYKTSKKLVNYLGLNYEDVVYAINENPDIADIEQAMLMMAVPAKTDNDLEKRYLYDFFDRLYYSNPSVLAFNAKATLAGAAANSFFGGDRSELSTAIVIKDARFKMALANDGIARKTVGGVLGPIGTCTSLYSTQSIAVPTIGSDFEGNTFVTQQIVFTKVHTYRKQTTISTFTEYQVVNLSMTYHIFGNYNDVGDGDEAILLIPLDYEIVKNYTLLEKEKITARSLHYVFNSRVVTKVKWYQQSWFSDFIKIVGIVLTVISLGSAGGLVSLINAAIIMGGNALVLVVIEVLLVTLLTSFVAKVFIKAVGGELAIIIAFVAAVFGITKGVQAGSLTGAPWAKELLQLSSGLTKAIGEVLTEQMQGLKQDFLNFADFMKEANKELEAANKLLENKDSWLSPIVIFGETPNEYFQRTVHSGNIGVLGLAAIGSYVENALELPRINQTIEGF
jgi:hypothetical protein